MRKTRRVNRVEIYQFHAEGFKPNLRRMFRGILLYGEPSESAYLSNRFFSLGRTTLSQASEK